MGKINIIAKWDLENSQWIMPNKEQYGRSFAIATYSFITNNPNGKYNFIIIANGSRVEDHSKDSVTIPNKALNINHVITHYEKGSLNYQIQTFLMDADAPIIEDAKLFAQYIDSLSVLPSTNTINIIGLSKCGVMSFYVPSFFQNKESFEKTNLYNVASPYLGTKLASPLVFYPEVENIICSKLGHNPLSNTIYKKLIEFYESISSNSHMDYDIAISGGVPPLKKHLYDETLISGIFSDRNVDSINKINSFKNFVTGIDRFTLKEAIRTFNFTGIGLCILDDVFFNHSSDGMVYVSDQYKCESYLDIKSYILKSAHHDVNSNIRVLDDILHIVSEVIAETCEKKLILQRNRH